MWTLENRLDHYRIICNVFSSNLLDIDLIVFMCKLLVNSGNLDIKLLARRNQIICMIFCRKILLRKNATFFDRHLVLFWLIGVLHFWRRCGLSNVIRCIILAPILKSLKYFIYCNEFDRILLAEIWRSQIMAQMIVDQVGYHRLTHSIVSVILWSNVGFGSFLLLSAIGRLLGDLGWLCLFDHDQLR